MTKRGLQFLVALLLPLAAAGQEVAGDYTVGPRDLLEVRVLEIPELNVERRVSDSGAIELPLLGEIPVSGMSASQISARVEALLTAKYVNRANVSVVIKEFANKPVSIVGAVQKPGSLNISGRWTLLQAISAAGGITPDAGRKIYILRKADNGLSDILEVNTEDLMRSASSSWNIPLVPGDIVNIQAKRQIKVFCLGEVKSPGALEFDGDDRISLLSAIAKAGGLTDRASNKIRIKRRGEDGRDKEIVANFNRIVSGKDPDTILQPDDVVIVKESFF
jgi:polysaccharide export outer membrane protein